MPIRTPDGLIKVLLREFQGVHVVVHDAQVEVVALAQVVANQRLAAVHKALRGGEGSSAREE